MWFRRKQKNRRFHRGHVLDVKLRSDQVRATRLRLGAIALGASFATVFGLYLVWQAGDWALDKLVYENNAFAISQIKVTTDGVIASDQLQRWSGVKIGDNLFRVDLAEVKRNLEMAPMVQSVSIERILPHTLRVAVNERMPVAQVNVPGLRPGGGVQINVFQLDADGFVILPLDARDRAIPLNQQTDQLPVIAGLEPTQLQPGRKIDAPQLQAALQLIGAFDHSPMAGLVDLRRIDVSAPQVLVATTDQGSQITFALQDLEKQLRRWRATYDFGQSKNRVIGTLNLAVENNVPVRWLEVAAPPATRRATEPSHNRTNRRRNV